MESGRHPPGQSDFCDRPLLDVFGIVDTEPRTPILGIMDEVDDIAVVLFIVASGPYFRCIHRLASQNAGTVVKAPALAGLIVVLYKPSKS